MQPSSRSSFGSPSKSDSSTGLPYSTVILGKRTNLPFCFTYSALRTVMGRMGTFAMRAITDTPAWMEGTRSVLPRRVPSGRMPTSSWRLSMRTARLMEVMSAVSRFTGKAPTRESAWYMKTTSKNDVWLQMTSAPSAPWKARSLSRLSTR